MSLGKKDIIKNISSKAQISKKDSHKLLNQFIKILLSKTQDNSVKISNFGTFYYHKSPKRIGRNPKTKQEFSIDERYKLTLLVSDKIKKLIN